MFEYMLGTATDRSITVEIAAMGVAEIDTSQSTVSGDKATFHIIAAAGADTGKVKVGYRVNSQGRVSVRSVLASDTISWSACDDVQRGVALINVPSAAVVNAIVSYNGIPQHHWWFSDPATSQNSRRAVFEAFDPRLETLRDILAKAQGRNPEARQLESAVSWLLWMLGFSPAHLGGTPRTQDAVDLIVTTPGGHFAVVECTTGLLKADNKLPHLHDRAEAVRRSLLASNQAFLRVIPVILTSKTKDEVKPDIEQAERLGILVLTKDDFEQVIARTIMMPNADRLFEEAEATIRAAQDSYEIQHLNFPSGSPVLA